MLSQFELHVICQRSKAIRRSSILSRNQVSTCIPRILQYDVGFFHSKWVPNHCTYGVGGPGHEAVSGCCLFFGGFGDQKSYVSSEGPVAKRAECVKLIIKGRGVRCLDVLPYC